MMSVKGGTQTWSSSPQRTDFKDNNPNTLSATDKEKVMAGEEAIGDVLNKVADPNYVDKSKKMRTVGNNQLGKDAFMTLLLTQMKNQDPTNPLKSHEMAAQLAQFTSLEKLHNINEGITQLHKDAQPNQNFQALSFIGKIITTDNSKITRMDTESTHDIRFNLAADAQKITMQVKDEKGAVIRTLDFKNIKAGKNELAWNGMTEDGTKAPVGEYSVAIEATGSNGHKLQVETKTEGVITGVNFTPRGPQLMLGKQVVNMSDVKSISEPGLSEKPNQLAPEARATGTAPNAVPPAMSAAPPAMNAAPTAMNAAPSKPKHADVKPETKPNAAKAAKLASGSINDAGMAQGLINKLNKEGAKAGMDAG
jgi:flagellar basal-body rod modification protein FlgD